MSRAVSPMQALREAFLEVDMEELMLSDEEDGSSEAGGGVAERDLPSGAHWASAWAAAADAVELLDLLGPREVHSSTALKAHGRPDR